MQLAALKLGWIPLFGTDLSGPGMLPAVLVLAIMILPTITAISRDALVVRAAEAARGGLRPGRDALGERSWPSSCRRRRAASSAAFILAFGRALGETMALAMLVGNANQISAVALLAGEHAGGAAGQQFPRGRRQAGRRADVRRPGAARHHAAGQHRRRR